MAATFARHSAVAQLRLPTLDECQEQLAKLNFDDVELHSGKRLRAESK